MNPTPTHRPPFFTLSKPDQSSARVCALQLIQEAAISPQGTLQGVEVYDITAKGSNIRRAIRLDWERLSDRGLYWRNRGADTQSTSVDGDAMVIMMLIAMDPQFCPVPFMQTEALNFAPWLFSGQKLSFLLDEGVRPVLDADMERRFAALRRRMSVWMNNDIDRMAGPIAFKHAMDHMLSTVKLPDSALRLGGIVPREWHTYVDLVTLKRSLIANCPRPRGFDPGLQVFTDDAEHDAITSGQRTGVTIKDNFAAVHLPTYIDQVWDSQIINPWCARQELVEDHMLPWGTPLPTEIEETLRRGAKTWLATQFEPAPAHQCDGIWRSMNLGIPYSADIVIVRRVSSMVATNHEVDSEEQIKDDRVIQRSHSTRTRPYERKVYRVDIPREYAMHTNQGYVSYVWPARGVFVSPESINLTAGQLLLRYQTKFASEIRFRQGGIDNSTRDQADSIFRTHCHSVAGDTFVSWNLIKTLCDELPATVIMTLSEAFDRDRDIAFQSVRERAVLAMRGEGKVVRANLPFTLVEDTYLWDKYRRYVPDSYWQELLSNMPRQSITRIKRRSSLIHKARQVHLSIEQFRDEAQLRKALPDLPEHYDGVINVC